MKHAVKFCTLALTAAMLLASCGTATKQQETTTSTEATTVTTTTTAAPTTTTAETAAPAPVSDPNTVYIIHEGATKYSVVLPAASLTKPAGSGMGQNSDTGKLEKLATTVDTPMRKATQALIDALTEKTGVTIPMTDDATVPASNAGEYEILIGLTNREESIALHKSLKERSFAVKTTATQLIIVGYDDNMTVEGVRYCLDNYILGIDTVGQVIEQGVFTVPSNMTAASPVAAQTPGNTIRPGGEYALVDGTEFLNIAPDGYYSVMQGGCTDGEYLYYCIENQRLEAHESYIYKISSVTGEVVQRSASLQLDHSNDITYNAKLNQLLVVHNAPNRKLVSFIDANTLEKIKTVNIGREIFSMAYNETRDQYVVGISGGQTFTILDSELNRVREYVPVPATQNTTQGMTCDDNYIYFAQSGANVVVVYDWDGHQVCIIPLEFTDIEVENISIIGNDIYIGFNPNYTAGVVYRTKLTVKK